MAEVTLDHVYFHLASDLSDYCSAVTDGEASSPSVPGQVTEYAGGRLAGMSRDAEFEPVTFTLNLLNRSAYWWLKDHKGQLVMVRDEVGEKVYGIYWEVNRAEHPGAIDDEGRAAVDVSLTVNPVTFSEEV